MSALIPRTVPDKWPRSPLQQRMEGQTVRLEEYPAQEPPSHNGRVYGDKVMQLGAGREGFERRYAEDAYQSLAVFRAGAPNGALLAFMHGGGWTNGYKEWMAFMAPAFTAAGVTFASIGY